MRKTLLTLLISALLPMSAVAATQAGQVVFATGTPTAVDDSGNSRVLSKGKAILSGDTIETEKGLLQIKFTDGGFMSFRPHSQFKIEHYRFSGKQDGTERNNLFLKRGGVRTVTGLIGKKNRRAYQFRTPVASIGIRGTKFLLELENGLLIHMGEDGTIEVHRDDSVLFLTALEVITIGGKEVLINLLKSGGIEALGPIGSSPSVDDVGDAGVGDGGYTSGDQVNDQGESSGASEGSIGVPM